MKIGTFFLSVMHLHNLCLRLSSSFINHAFCLYMVEKSGSSWLMSAERRLKQPGSAVKLGAKLCLSDLQAKICAARPEVQPASPSTNEGAVTVTPEPLRQRQKVQETPVSLQGGLRYQMRLVRITEACLCTQSPDS